MSAKAKEAIPIPAVRRIRNAAGMTQHELANLMGVHAITVSKWERGLSQPTRWHWEVMHSLEDSPDRARVAEHLWRHGPARALALALRWIVMPSRPLTNPPPKI